MEICNVFHLQKLRLGHNIYVFCLRTSAPRIGCMPVQIEFLSRRIHPNGHKTLNSYRMISVSSIESVSTRLTSYADPCVYLLHVNIVRPDRCSENKDSSAQQNPGERLDCSFLRKNMILNSTTALRALQFEYSVSSPRPETSS